MSSYMKNLLLTTRDKIHNTFGVYGDIFMLLVVLILAAACMCLALAIAFVMLAGIAYVGDRFGMEAVASILAVIFAAQALYCYVDGTKRLGTDAADDACVGSMDNYITATKFSAGMSAFFTVVALVALNH